VAPQTRVNEKQTAVGATATCKYVEPMFKKSSMDHFSIQTSFIDMSHYRV
jgi:hypothetical protein